jgi:hypothetical protein
MDMLPGAFNYKKMMLNKSTKREPKALRTCTHCGTDLDAFKPNDYDKLNSPDAIKVAEKYSVCPNCIEDEGYMRQERVKETMLNPYTNMDNSFLSNMGLYA